MTTPLHVFYLRSDQQTLDTLLDAFLNLHLDDLWMRIPKLEGLHWGEGEVLQLEIYHLRDGTPVMPEAGGAELSNGERDALRLSVDSSRTSVAYELFRNGESVGGWAGDVECFGSDDKRAKNDRQPGDLLACRRRFLDHFRAETGLEFEALVSSHFVRDDAPDTADSHGLLLVHGRLIKPVEGMGRWPELFRFHDRNEGEQTPGREHAVLVGLDMGFTEKLWRRTPASQVYQYLRMIEPLRLTVLGPLAGLLPEVLNAVESHPPEQPLASAAAPSLTVYEVLAMSSARLFMVGDRVEYLDGRFYPMLSLSDKSLSKAAVAESADEISDLDIVSAVAEVMPYSVPEGEMMDSFADEELMPLASWAVADGSYEGSLLLLDTCRIRGLIEAFDIDMFNERIKEFQRLWFEVTDGSSGTSFEEWLAGRGERDGAELSRFEDTFVELQHLLPLCEGSGFTPAVLFYSE